MTPIPTDKDLVIKPGECFSVGDIPVKAIAYLGLLTPGVHYFQVELQNDDGDFDGEKLGLLRIAATKGSLGRELKLRETLGDYALVSQLLSHTIAESVLINPPTIRDAPQMPESVHSEVEDEHVTPEAKEDLEPEVPGEDNQVEVKLGESGNIALTIEVSTENPFPALENDSDDLEEEYYPEVEVHTDESPAKLLLLTPFPSEQNSLATWLQTQHTKEEYLSVVIQVCQFSSYLYQRQRFLVDLLPQFIQIQIGRPLQFFDLSTVYALDAPPQSGLISSYCAPELASGQELEQSMASYAISALLYHCSHHRPLPSEQKYNISLDSIPRIYQLLKIGLSPIPEERFPLAQLMSLLVETRNLFRAKKMQWQVASYSTVGLSTSRLTNEDNYGVRQQQLGDFQTLIMGIVADGMGGMAQGEVASQIAVQTLLSEPISPEFKTPDDFANWLIELFQKANQAITNDVKDGGTTLSAVLGIGDRLMVAHVGDSRIYHIRQGEISQLSEDHSMVAMMVASGQITQEESLEHPDRNVLTKSLGAKRILPQGYVQDLKRTKQELAITLEDRDILLLCSDGVWDLVTTEEINKIFTDFDSLQSAVDTAIERVLERGASDNATLLALQCRVEKNN